VTAPDPAAADREAAVAGLGNDPTRNESGADVLLAGRIGEESPRVLSGRRVQYVVAHVAS